MISSLIGQLCHFRSEYFTCPITSICVCESQVFYETSFAYLYFPITIRFYIDGLPTRYFKKNIWDANP